MNINIIKNNLTNSPNFYLGGILQKENLSNQKLKVINSYLPEENLIPLKNKSEGVLKDILNISGKSTA